jgi:drug/metabolite transporter (DMT)-like permease
MVLALQGLPLQTVVAWNALTFLLTPAAGAVFLHEKLDARILAGGGLIALGIIVFSV